MRIKEKEVRCGEFIWFAVGSILTVAGFFVTLSFIRKYGNKTYKKLLNTEEIDFDNMGPEIVPFNEKIKEEK